MPDCAILGGGVIGLSIAYELACHGQDVLLLERGELGREASWAGAGILPAPTSRDEVPVWKKLQALSFHLHKSWHERLKEETGIDNGYLRCGGIHLAREVGEAAALRADMAESAADGVEVQTLEAGPGIQHLEPTFSRELASAAGVAGAFLLPAESQIRNPHHLQALAAACRRRNVRIVEQAKVTRLASQNGRVEGAVTNSKTYQADAYIITSGAWSDELLSSLGVKLSIYPVRGQMLLYECPRKQISHIINEGPRYLVPRADNFVLVGSTEEDVGFDKQTTAGGLAELRQFAEELFPCLREGRIVNSWAGLRPHAVDGFPYLGPISHLANCYVAAGHYRAGLSTSPGTARLMRQMILGEPTELDVSEFRVDR